MVTLEPIDDRDIAEDHAILKVFAEQVAALGPHCRRNHWSVPPRQLVAVLEIPGFLEKTSVLHLRLPAEQTPHILTGVSARHARLEFLRHRHMELLEHLDTHAAVAAGSELTKPPFSLLLLHSVRGVAPVHQDVRIHEHPIAHTKSRAWGNGRWIRPEFR